MSTYLIGFVGLSHLGIVSSIAAASKGFEVIAYDPSEELCRDLQQGRLPISEPGLAELLSTHRSQIRFTSDTQELTRSDLVYFSGDIPTDSENRSDLSNLVALIHMVARKLRRETIAVVLSQVPPGFTRRLSLPNLYYQVETLIFGRAVERALQPERIIVGCDDPKKGLPEAYEHFLKSFHCPILTMRYESAELCKISINTLLAASLSATNMLSEICEKVGADWAEITPALKLDRRIGPYAYIQPGLGIAGGNIERDLVAVRKITAEVGTDDRVAQAFLASSSYCRHWVLRRLQPTLAASPDPLIAVWGLAYKPDTASTKNSPTVSLLENLKEFRIRLYDPQARLDSPYDRITEVGSALSACQGVDALVIMTPWSEFSTLSPSAVREVMKGSVVIDPAAAWRTKDVGDIRYATLGTPS